MQYMMAEKARYFRDKKTAEAILQSTSPKEIKELGRKVCNFNTERWNYVKVDIVTTGNIYKFTQYMPSEPHGEGGYRGELWKKLEPGEK